MRLLNFTKYTLLIVLLAIGFNTIDTQKLSAQVIAVIANADVEVEKLSKEDVFKLYSQQQKFWGNGNEVHLTDYNASAGIRKAFFAKLQKDSGFFEKLWQRNKFQGEANPPVVEANEKAIVDKIVATPGAIGFVSIAQVREGVKILLQF